MECAANANDEVYIVGNLMFRNCHEPSYYLNQLKGRKQLIIGNYDKAWMKMVNSSDYFISVDKELLLRCSHKRYTLSHYPWIEYPGSRYTANNNAYMIHGHVHSRKTSCTYEIVKKYLPNLLNYGQDICNFRPVAIEELIEKNNEWYQR